MFIVIKSVRDTAIPYQGVTLEKAISCGEKLPSILRFEALADAQQAAETLSKYNPVGFKVFVEHQPAKL